MSEFALHGVEQLLTSMHVEFAIDMRDMSLYRTIGQIQRFTDIRPTTTLCKEHEDVRFSRG